MVNASHTHALPKSADCWGVGRMIRDWSQYGGQAWAVAVVEERAGFLSTSLASQGLAPC
jgi:hypothetical protein